MILSKIRHHIQEGLNLQHLKLWCIIKWTYQLNLNMKPLRVWYFSVRLILLFNFSHMVTTAFQFFIWLAWYRRNSKVFRHPNPVLHMKPLKVCCFSARLFFLFLIHGNYHLPTFHLTGMILPKQPNFQTPKASSATQLQKHPTVHRLLHLTSDVYEVVGVTGILKLTKPIKAYKK